MTKSAHKLRIENAAPFTTTPNHRIIVPSDCGGATVKAIDLKVGSLVMCSDCMPKKVRGKKEFIASGLPQDATVGQLILFNLF